MDETEWMHQSMEAAVSATTNLALALELWVKILHFQLTQAYPSGGREGHDLSVIGLNFPEPILNRLREEYLLLRSDPKKPELLWFSFKAGPTQPASPLISPARQPASPPATAGTYDDAIKTAGRAYVRWRYVYEEMVDSLDASLSFETLFLLSKTIMAVSGTLKGKARASLVSRS